MSPSKARILLLLMVVSLVSCTKEPSRPRADLVALDQLSAMWSFYKYHFIRDGRVIALDEKEITTSEGQGYGMLRSVWSGDRDTFDKVWRWTETHLRVRGDSLFAWKWKGKVLDRNSATDADTDIALALLLAARRWQVPRFRRQALEILGDIWNKEILKVGQDYYVTAGNWAPAEPFPVIHLAYLAPYAYEIFASEDSAHPWKRLVDSSYRLLETLYFEKGIRLPPEIVYVDKRDGKLLLSHGHGTAAKEADFSYDAFPLFWRMALDKTWNGRRQSRLYQRMLEPFGKEWARTSKLVDRYRIDGTPLSSIEGNVLYATVHALALAESHPLAEELESGKLSALRETALRKTLPYYLHNWLWLGMGYELQRTLTFDEVLGFLRPFDYKGFSSNFLWWPFAAMLILFLLSSISPVFQAGFLALGFFFCARYLWWRLFHSLNFIETAGPFITLALWLAEVYCFSTVALLVVQVGWRRRKAVQPVAPVAEGFTPSVDIFVPIYSESLDILEKTLIAAWHLDYPNKKIFVCDDSHREAVAELAVACGATYIKGPKKHAKAGNLNNALSRTSGELVVVFDTDHIPVSTFLRETVPHFSNPKVGFLQTPHHFYNQDIFQRALGAGHSIPNEQDMFNHAIQGGRDVWKGAFFVGSGAVFRRRALEQLNGFNLMSITEDIHTSQHLHAAGWESVFVDKDSAVGLTAENLSSYIVQRRRWMLGCLQIFFKDNPLFCKGLPPRHRVGYFASLYYFFFPVSRVVFWATPLFFLLFHWHPILSEVSVLVAYIIPFMVALPLINSALLPGWPRFSWGIAYEMVVVFPLFRSIFDLFLPKNLGFKVTPKGIVSEKRSFDLSSSRLVLGAMFITALAFAKGLAEFHYFAVEKDAYFFNLLWTGYNFMFLASTLLIAWERPQRRTEERIARKIPVKLEGEGFTFEGHTHDASLTGLSLLLPESHSIPSALGVQLGTATPIDTTGRLIFNEKIRRAGWKCGIELPSLTREHRRALFLELFASPRTWESFHEPRSRYNWVVAVHFLLGVLRCFLPLKLRRRKAPRKKVWRSLIVRWPEGERRVFLRDVSPHGVGLIHFGKDAVRQEIWRVPLLEGGTSRARQVYEKKICPMVWRVGVRLESPPAKEEGMPLPHAL